MSLILKGKKVVVTGASSGIGKAIAIKFGEEGAGLAILARREDRLNETKNEIEAKGGRAFVFKVDLLQDQKIGEVFNDIRRTLGDPDILVNNAGTGFFGKSIVDSTLEEFDQTFKLNVRAYYLCIKQVLPAMIRSRDGVIINISSISGKMGMPNAAIYCASKFAVMGLCESILEEVRQYNIRVSMICPGLVRTEFPGRGRPIRGNVEDYIQPEDVAEAAFLCARDTQTATFKEIIVRPRRPIK